MINLVAMAAILAAIFISRRRRTIPMVMLAYYAVTIASMYVLLGTIDTYEPVVLSESDALLWYITSISIDVIFVTALSIACTIERMCRIYCVLILYVVSFKVFGIFYGNVNNEWFSDVYEFCKSFVVELEIIIAWLASDNPVSRKIYRFWDTACQTKSEL